jgi:uncharacterized membrane protein YphA (DoxX/SURF4 family)
MFGRLLSTRSDPVLTIVRLVFGIVFPAHGAQRVFGDVGFEGTVHFVAVAMARSRVGKTEATASSQTNG